MSYGNGNPKSKYRLYVGNITHKSHPRDIEDLFRDYGELADFDFKDRGQQVNFCFVEFKSSRAAEDAMYELNGKRVNGVPIIVEPAKERRSRRNNFGGDRGGGRGGGHDNYQRRDQRGGGHYGGGGYGNGGRGRGRDSYGHNGHSNGYNNQYDNRRNPSRSLSNSRGRRNDRRGRDSR